MKNIILVLTILVSITSYSKPKVTRATPSWLLPDEKNTAEVFAQASPLVVYVHNLAHNVDFFSMRTNKFQQGTGSGFLWDDKGHIVTNFHVIQNADRVEITLSNGKTVPATIVGYEPRKDLAVLKIQPSEFTKHGFSSKLAKSSEIIVGQKTIAIGNPFGLDHSLTVGVVSALDRSIETFANVTIRDMIQTDASINPGNSGGPLLDSRGYLMGMNTAIFSSSGSSAGIGFAVPSDTIAIFVEQIIKFGKVIIPGLGIIPVRDELAYRFSVERGVLIAQVSPQTGASRAGLKGTVIDQRNRKITLGDVIIGINEDKIDNYDDIFNSLIKRKIGDTVNVRFLRDGKERTLTVKLQQVND